MSAKRKFAVFDIDGTLIRWQLFHAIVHHLGVNGYIPASEHAAIKAARMTWKNRTGEDDFRTYEHVLVGAYRAALKDIDPVAYDAVVSEVFDEYKDQTFVYTRDLLSSLRKQGYLTFAISGSHEDIIKKLAAHHGFDDVVGAVPERIDEKFTGNLDTPVLDKPRALNMLINKHHATFTGSIGVGDSEGDIPMLEMVEYPIVFNPSAGLYTVAKKRKWKIVLERKNVIYELENRHGSYVLA